MQILLKKPTLCRLAALLIAVLVLLPTHPVHAVLLTFDTVVGAPTSAGILVTNTDGSQYGTENNGGAGNAPVPVSGAGQAAIGNGSWQAAANNNYNTLTVYSNIGPFGSSINEEAFTGSSTPGARIRIRDIESFSWSTNRPENDFDWFAQIYTATTLQGGPDPGTTPDDSASWYGRRLTSETRYTVSGSALVDPLNTFNFFHTDDVGGANDNQVGFYDRYGNNGPANTNIGFVDNPPLTDLQAGPITWATTYPNSVKTVTIPSPQVTSSDPIDYRDEWISLFRLGISSTNENEALLDNFTFTLKSSFDPGFDPLLVPGTTVTIDFEDPNFVAPVPEPASLLMIASGLWGLGLLRRRRQRKA